MAAEDPSPSARPSQGARVGAVVLTALCAFFWIGIVPNLATLGGSDAAGNAMAQGFMAIAVILLWVLLSVLALIAGINGMMPAWARLALLIVPVSGVAAVAALELLAHREIPPGLWPIMTPALVPPLVVAFSLWSVTRPVPALGAAAVLGAIVLVSTAIIPLTSIRTTVVMERQKADAAQRSALARVPDDAPLWELTPFLKARDLTIADAALARIQELARRQRDAETMLARGDFPLGYLPRFQLDPTPAVCDGTRALLRERVKPLILTTPNSKPYAVVAQEVEDAVADMTWLIGFGCDCTDESRAWEDMANAYRDTSYDVVRLRELRQAGTLGRRMREYPDKFSQLGPQSHLKAWLRWSDDKALLPQIVAGIRTLDHRTADAVEILNDKYETGSYSLLRLFPEIDLEATPALCAAASRVIFSQFRSVYRPKPGDEPRPYTELIDRLGAGEPLSVLIWLGQHGCDVAVESHEAEAAVSAYQDSPRRTAMLATLARLQGR